MPLFTVDSNNVFGIGVQEAGKYNVKVVKAETGTTGRGQDKLTLDYEVVDGKYKGGQIRYQVMTWDDDAEHIEMTIKRFNSFVIAFGAKDGTAINSLSDIAKAAFNRELSVDAGWGEPNNRGNVYLQVNGYHALDPEGSQPNGIKRPNGNQSSPTTSNNAQPAGTSGDQIEISDDDLPF